MTKEEVISEILTTFTITEEGKIFKQEKEMITLDKKSGCLRFNHRGFDFYNHRIIFYKFFNELPSNIQIFHKDNNKVNNQPSNLTLKRNEVIEAVKVEAVKVEAVKVEAVKVEAVKVEIQSGFKNVKLEETIESVIIRKAKTKEIKKIIVEEIIEPVKEIIESINLKELPISRHYADKPVKREPKFFKLSRKERLDMIRESAIRCGMVKEISDRDYD